MADIATTLTELCGLPVAAHRDEPPVDSPATAFRRDDGFVVALNVPATLAAAILAHRCGGRFVPVGGSGSGVRGIVAEIEAALLSAADRCWPGSGSWTVAPRGDRAATRFAAHVEIEGHDFVLGVAVSPAVAATAIHPDRIVERAGWTRAVRAGLDATPFAVRVVLHDRMIPLAEAIALRVGDIMPIETRREVSLRLGDRSLACGTIGPDDHGGHRITIVAVDAGGVIPAVTQEQP